MLGPSTSSERSTVNPNGHMKPEYSDSGSSRPDYDNVTATAAAAVSASGYGSGLNADEANQFHPHHQNSYSATAAAAAAELQHRAELQRRQQQLQQQELHQHQQLQFQQHQQQQHHQQQMQQHHQQQQQQQQLHQHQMHQELPEEYMTGGVLTSRYIENEIIKTFTSKQELVKYVKYTLGNDERCKIVINSSKPKAVYFQCERSGSFRTTVKDSTKRQRIAYTKRNKCCYRLVANLYPPDKDKKKSKKHSPDSNLDDKLSQLPNGLGDSGLENDSMTDIWILRMINPIHNHAPEPLGKKKRLKYSRTLVEKPLNRANSAADHYSPPDMSHLAHHQIPGLSQHLHSDPNQHAHSAQDAAVIAAIEATPSAAAAAAAALHSQNAPVDPNIDPNVDPSVQAHDHSHGMRGNIHLHNMRR